MNDGRFFFQKMSLPYSIDGQYTFKTSDNKYHSIKYLILEPFSVEAYVETELDETTEQNFDDIVQFVPKSSFEFRIDGK